MKRLEAHQAAVAIVAVLILLLLIQFLSTSEDPALLTSQQAPSWDRQHPQQQQHSPKSINRSRSDIINSIDAGQWQLCDSAETADADVVAACAYQRQHRWSQDMASSVFVPYRSQAKAAKSSSLHCPVRLSQLDALRCFSNQRLLFIGDSTMQELVVDLVSHLEGLSSEFILPPWITYTCPGGKNNLMYRVFTTAAYPSPALTAYNITLAFLFNGHAAICENTGDIQQQLGQRTWLSVLEMKAQCPDTFQHYRALGLLDQQLATFDTAVKETGTDSEATAAAAQHLRAVYESLLLMSPEQRLRVIRATPAAAAAAVETAAIALGIHTHHKLNITCGITRDWPSILQLLLSRTPAAAAAVAALPAWSERQVMRLNRTHDPSVSVASPLPHHNAVAAVDVVVYNTGQHITAGWPYDQQLAATYEAVVAVFMQLLLLGTGQRVVWKDSTPVQPYPGMVHFNHIARAIAADLQQQQQQQHTVTVWPVQQVLSFVDKEDSRHCSYKSTAESFDARSVDVRSPFCHEAVQMLMRSLCSSEQCQ